MGGIPTFGTGSGGENGDCLELGDWKGSHAMGQWWGVGEATMHDFVFQPIDFYTSLLLSVFLSLLLIPMIYTFEVGDVFPQLSPSPPCSICAGLGVALCLL